MDASTKPILVNRKQAEQVAKIFMRHSHIHGVELFGRTAREGQGNDLDLVLLVSLEDADTFTGMVRSKLMEISTFGDPERYILEGPELQKACTYNSPNLRMEMARVVLSDRAEGFRVLQTEAEGLVFPAALDIFLFPGGWRYYIRSLQEDLPHKDPHFMENIARDAVRIA